MPDASNDDDLPSLYRERRRVAALSRGSSGSGLLLSLAEYAAELDQRIEAMRHAREQVPINSR